MARTQLLIIDPQNDFCDLPAASGGQPALPVAGADADMQRLARFIDNAGDALDAITVTLDSHHRLDIAHPGFWQAAEGGAVSPFTTITAAQLREGAFRPRDPAALPRTQAYLDALEAAGRYTLMVWPVHCEIGSWGHNVHADVRAAYNRWEERRHAVVSKVSKGENPWTEHYSAVQAEVPDEEDAHTRLNRGLIDALDDSELLFIAGEASSHCVKATTEHIVEHLPGGKLGRIVLLTDCMSPVTGFEAQAEGFLAAMQARGLRLMRSSEALGLLNKTLTA
jgi:nicotinamidase-related amidase